MLSYQNKKLIFIIINLLLFVSIFLLIIFKQNPLNDLFCHFTQCLIAGLLCLCYPANLFLSGTGILIYLSANILVLILCTLIFSQITFIFGIPLLLLIQFFSRKNIDYISKNKHELLLNIEKVKEKNNDLILLTENMKSKKIALTQQINRFSNLKEYVSKITLSLSPENIHEMILNFVGQNIPNGDIYSLSLLNKNEKLITSSFIVKENTQHILLQPDKTDIFNKWVMTYRSPLLINHIYEDYRFQIDDYESLLFPSTKSTIISPMISDDKPMGLLRIDSKESSKFQTNDFRLLVLISNISALSLRNAELFKETQILSITDGLTGLYLPHYLNEQMTDFINTFNNEKHLDSFSFLMMDLDHFKNINDNFGHVVGDNVLIHAGKLISQFCPQEGLAIRYGGEEFALFLPHCSKTSAFSIAEKIRTAFFEKKIIVRKKIIKLSISIGISTFPDDSQDRRMLIQKADERLYKAKKSGRNKTVTAS